MALQDTRLRVYRAHG